MISPSCSSLGTSAGLCLAAGVQAIGHLREREFFAKLLPILAMPADDLCPNKEVKTISKAIALLGEYTPAFPPHASTHAAIGHSRTSLKVDITADWVSTANIEPALFERYSGIWLAPGSPYLSQSRMNFP